MNLSGISQDATPLYVARARKLATTDYPYLRLHSCGSDLTFSDVYHTWRKFFDAFSDSSTDAQNGSTLMNNDQILTDLLRREGGLENDPADPGGVTNYGLTIKSLSEYYGHDVTAKDVENLTAPVARAIYADMYIDKPGFNKIRQDNIRALLVDCAVNNGRGRAIKWLQHAVGAVEDGVLGDRTVASIEGRIIREVYYGILKQRYACYAALPSVNPKLMKFLGGWIKRANEFLGVNV